MKADELYERLGFKVENERVISFETRKNFEDKIVPKSVRPATKQEIDMWNLLVNDRPKMTWKNVP